MEKQFSINRGTSKAISYQCTEGERVESRRAGTPEPSAVGDAVRRSVVWLSDVMAIMACALSSGCALLKESHKGALASCRTAHIQVSETHMSHDRTNRLNLSLPFADRAAKILELAGISTVLAGEQADLSFLIVVQGEELAPTYVAMPPHGKLPFDKVVGSLIEGTIIVSNRHIRPWAWRFSGGTGAPQYIWAGVTYGARWQHSFELCSFSRVLLSLVAQNRGFGVLTNATADSNWLLRKAAAELLPDWPGPESTRMLGELLSDPVREVRVTAAGRLRDVPDAEAGRLLLEALRSGDAFTRGVAARYLGERRETRAVDDLIRCLADLEVTGGGGGGLEPATRGLMISGAVVAEFAAKALGQIKDDRAVEPLIRALDNPRVRGAACRALRTITAQELDCEPEAWRAWRNPLRRP